LATNAPRTILEDFIKSLTKIYIIIIAVKLVVSLSVYSKIDVGWGLAPDPTGGVYSAPQIP